ncbi:unnamed protein product [Peniophora sp. CBMAI 1063]|nr:unnamed protein product [Peniophora sp. CBMAI 1063]
MARLAFALTAIFAARSALAAPFARDIMILERDTTPSFNLTQNALDAQALNSIFGTLSVNSSCSGQFENDMACVSNNVAVCQNGKWQTLDQCGQFQCLALPVMAGNGTTISCTSATFADEIFQQLGVESGFNSTTAANISAVAFPILPSNTTANAANSTTSGDDAEGDDEDCAGDDDGEDATFAPAVVTQTVIVTVTATPASSPSTIVSQEAATTVVLSQASASAIIASIEANGGTVVTSVAHKHHKTASTAAPTSTEVAASTAVPTAVEASSSATNASAAPTKSILILNPAASASATA